MNLLATTMSVGDKFSVGGVTTLLGLGMTFLVLALLIGCIAFVSFVIKKIGKINFRKKKELVRASVEESAATENVEPEALDESTLLAIESAVKTYVRESATDGKPHDNVRIRSVVKK